MRLHIQPFSPALLDKILPASAIDLVENLSYHEIQTFPDKSYGYLDLPATEGEKLMKKLNGTIFKGKKMKIEEARPRKRPHEDDGYEALAVQSIEPTIESTVRQPKRKRNTEVISGHNLSPDRIIKRGWTEVKDEKTKRLKKEQSGRVPSRYTEKDELLFQTKIPANRKDLVKEDRKKNGKKRNAHGDVVHEFEKTEAQPSFLRSTSSAKGSSAREFVEGKGWVDENGEVLEPEPAGARRIPIMTSTRTTRSSITKTSPPKESDSSSEDGSTPRPPQRAAISGEPPSEPSDETSSSGSSSSNDESDSDDSNAPSSQASSGKEVRASSPNPNTSIHPLEALFKKPSKPASQDIAKPSLEIQTSFNFFDENGADIEEETVPGTPFSSQDTRSRGHRSAAPTPDTAHPSRYSSYSSHLGSSDDEDEEDDGESAAKSQRSVGTPSKPSTLDVPQEQSAFEKQFWEKRGELGRGWKRRRREVQKEKRQRDSRASKRSW